MNEPADSSRGGVARAPARHHHGAWLRFALAPAAIAIATALAAYLGPDPDQPGAEAHPVTYPDFLALVRDVDRLREAADVAVGECMEYRGWPQFNEALRAPLRDANAISHEPLHVHRLEIGPSEESEAAKYGIAGVEWAFQDAERPTVVSTNAQYDSALAECQSMQSSRRNSQLVDDFGSLLNGLGRALRESITPNVATILREQFTCIERNGRNLGDVGAWVAGDDLPALLDSIGVNAGHTTPIAGTLIEPGPDQVVVTATVGAPRYVPGDGEVDFAMEWVHCTEETRWPSRLEDMQAAPRKSLLGRYQGDLAAFRKAVTENIAILSASSKGGSS